MLSLTPNHLSDAQTSVLKAAGIEDGERKEELLELALLIQEVQAEIEVIENES